MTRRSPWWSLAFCLLFLLAAVGAGPGALAAVEPVPGSISSLRAGADDVTGLLTLRAGQQAVSVDPGLTATLGGKDASVSTKAASATARTTVLLIDTSGSMGASGMATVRTAVKDFLRTAPRDVRVGVVSFGSTAGPEVAPTTDRAAVQRAVDALRADGETALFDGVKEAVAMLGTAGDRSIVLLSDGKNTVGQRGTGLTSAVNALTRAQVRMEVVRFTTGENDPAALAAFARAGGGSVAQATDTAAVRRAFLAAAKLLDSQTEFEVVRPAGVTGRVPLELSGSANGRPFRVSAVVDLGASPTSSAPPSPTVVPTTSGLAPGPLTRVETGETNWTLLISLLALFLGTLLLVMALASPLFQSKRHVRVAELERYTLAGGGAVQEHMEAAPSAVAQSAVRLGERVMAKRSSTSRTMELIQRADLSFRAGEWWVLRVVTVVIVSAVLAVILPLPSGLGALVGALVGFVAPAMVLRFKAARRARKFESMLPDVLMLVATTLASGFSLTQALDAVARDSPEPAGKEFSRALAENRIGADISDALDHMAQRMDSESMIWTTMAIRIQRDVGGNLADTLRTTATTLREREALKRQVNTLSAEGKLSGYILIALPVFLFLYMSFVNPAYTSLLWTTLPGIVMLVGSCVGMVIGALWMRKVVQIDV